MTELEDETRFILVDGKPVSLQAVVDKILEKDEENTRRIGSG